MSDPKDRFDVGALLIGGVILFVGVYYLLDLTLGFNLGPLDWNAIWPILVIVVGASVLLGVLRRERQSDVH
jgi:formate hydrogenlyase subunit 3/multisubunit Na+/H+ antiporter MnhD subunit